MSVDDLVRVAYDGVVNLRMGVQIMSKEQLAAAMVAFEQKGGKVRKVKEGEYSIDPAIRYCKCGCRGDWTEHTMRLGESGRGGW